MINFLPVKWNNAIIIDIFMHSMLYISSPKSDIHYTILQDSVHNAQKRQFICSANPKKITLFVFRSTKTHINLYGRNTILLTFTNVLYMITTAREMDNRVQQQNFNATFLVQSKLTAYSEFHVSRFVIILSYPKCWSKVR